MGLVGVFVAVGGSVPILVSPRGGRGREISVLNCGCCVWRGVFFGKGRKGAGSFGSHHPAPAGFYPGHPAHFKFGRCAEVLLFHGGNGDGGGVCLVDCDGVFVVEGADLLLWHGFQGGSFAGLGV